MTARGASDPLSAFKPEKRRIRPSFVALGLLGLVFIAIVAGVMSLGSVDPPQPSPATSTLGVTLVNSRPSAAEVVIDGSRRGVTPVELSLPVGLHTLELRTDRAERMLPLSVQADVLLSLDVDFALDPSASMDPLGVGSNTGASPHVASGPCHDLKLETLLQ